MFKVHHRFHRKLHDRIRMLFRDEPLKFECEVVFKLFEEVDISSLTVVQKFKCT